MFSSTKDSRTLPDLKTVDKFPMLLQHDSGGYWSEPVGIRIVNQPSMGNFRLVCDNGPTYPLSQTLQSSVCWVPTHVCFMVI